MTDPDTGEPGKPLSRLGRAITDAAVVAAGIRLGADAGTIISAFSIPWAEELSRRARNEFRTDAEHRIANMFGTTANELNCDDPDRIGDMISQSEQTRLMAITAMDGAIRTAWPPRVAAIGRALAAGLLATDDTAIDVEQMALDAMADMGAPHVTLLELLVTRIPMSFEGRPFETRPYEPPSTPLDEGPPWAPNPRSWSIRQMGQAKPSLRPVLTSLIGTLRGHGLVVEDDNTAIALESFSEVAAHDVARRTVGRGIGRQRTPAMPRQLPPGALARVAPVPTWSPIELGERVLGYYRLAAESAVARPELSPTGGARRKAREIVTNLDLPALSD